MYVCMYVRTYVCMYVCKYVCVYKILNTPKGYIEEKIEDRVYRNTYVFQGNIKGNMELREYQNNKICMEWIPYLFFFVFNFC